MSNPELLRVEESVKGKYIELVKNLSYLELKNLNKSYYETMVLNDRMKVLPKFEKSQLKETAHYVSNALNNKAKRQMKKNSRVSNSSRDKNSDVLSTSVPKDLDTTMQPESSENDISVNSEDNDDDSEDQTASLIESDRQLDDSLTHLKQTVITENVDNESNPVKGNVPPLITMTVQSVVICA